MSIDSLVESCLNKKFHLNNTMIKCLLCGNYQHLRCSGFSLPESEYQIDANRYPYLCSRCWNQVEPIDSGSTLIVCPASICHQWCDEIQKHLKNVSVFKYHGIRVKGNMISFAPNK